MSVLQLRDETLIMTRRLTFTAWKETLLDQSSEESHPCPCAVVRARDVIGDRNTFQLLLCALMERNEKEEKPLLPSISLSFPAVVSDFSHG